MRDNNEKDDYSQFDEAPPPFAENHDLAEEEFDFQEEEQIQQAAPSVREEGTQLASHPAKSLAILVVLLAATIVFLYQVIFKEDEKTIAEKENQEIAAQQPIEAATPLPKDTTETELDFKQIEEPVLPEVDSLSTETPPPLPPSLDDVPIETPQTLIEAEPLEAPVTPVTPEVPETLPALPSVAAMPAEPAPLPSDVPAPQIDGTPPIATGPTEAEILAAKRAKRRGAMLLASGGGEPDTSQQIGGQDRVLTLNEVATSTAQKSLVGKLSQMDHLIAQGKMIHAVLETAINTDLPGSLRAIISRDVYAESGRNILIPKGSRLLGTYNSGVARGQKRVLITWQRVVMPNGLDIFIDSPGTDKLGRAGVRGLVDNKFFELFKNSFLLSALTIGGTIAIDAIQGGDSVTNTNSSDNQGNNTSTQTGTPTDFAVLDAVSDLGDISGSIAEGLLDAKPTIIVDQGTLVNVFVNKDLIFPADASNGNLKVIH